MKKKKLPFVEGTLYPKLALYIAIAVGIVLLVGTIVFAYYQKRVLASYAIVDAKISFVDYIGGDDYTAYVDYTYNAVAYTKIRLSDYNSTYVVGRSLQIYVNPANPTDIQSVQGTSVLIYVLIGAGAFFTLLGIGSLIADFIHDRTFVPAHNPANLTQARLSGIEESKNNRFILSFTKNGTTYKSPSCRGHYASIAALLKNGTAVDADVYLDSKGNFVPDFKKLCPQLEKLCAGFKEEAAKPASNSFLDSDGSNRY
jgi:hypothetical protein